MVRQLNGTWKFNDRVESADDSVVQAEVFGVTGVVPECLRHPQRADEQIGIYPAYQPYTKTTLDISGMIRTPRRSN